MSISIVFDCPSSDFLVDDSIARLCTLLYNGESSFCRHCYLLIKPSHTTDGGRERKCGQWNGQHGDPKKNRNGIVFGEFFQVSAFEMDRKGQDGNLCVSIEKGLGNCCFQCSTFHRLMIRCTYSLAPLREPVMQSNIESICLCVFLVVKDTHTHTGRKNKNTAHIVPSKS